MWRDDLHLKAPSNCYLAVRGAPNIANPFGLNDHKGVFARVKLPRGLKVCPYVGVLKDKKPKKGNQYALRIDKDKYIDATHVLYDIGYLLHDPDYEGSLLDHPGRCPPNYGRYVNGIGTEPLDMLHYSVNCEFIACDTGHDEMWLYTTQIIEEGQELILDYGDEFVIRK